MKNQKTPKNTCSPNVKNPGKLRNIENFQGFEHSKVLTRGYSISPMSIGRHRLADGVAGLFHRLDKCEMKKCMDFDGL